MKLNKKLLACGLMAFVIVAGGLISGCITKNQLKERSIPPKFRYDPKVGLPEVYVGNHSIFSYEFNTSKWYNGSFSETYLEKYSNFSKELIEIMKIQVAVLGEDPDLFERCIYSIGDNDSNEICLPCFAWKGKFADCNNHWILDDFEDKSKYGNKEVWELTFIICGKDISSFYVINTYYVDVDTLTPFPFIETTN
jgi:hypothetical protein